MPAVAIAIGELRRFERSLAGQCYVLHIRT
jgi:hypothetical protein